MSEYPEEYPTLVPRFIKYVKINTRSNPNSDTVPSDPKEVKFLHQLVDELKEIGLTDAAYDEESGYTMATLPSNIDEDVPTIGFLAHTDTADFNAEGVNPQIHKDYDGESTIKLDPEGKYVLDPKSFPFMKNYKGQTLITTDGSTLLGADDKSGVAEIMTAMEYLVKHPEIKHGRIRVGFSPDEEIGTGAKHFNVKKFDADFAYTVDGGPLGQLEWETFNAAELNLYIQGKDVHPSDAKGIMVNANELGVKFQMSLPQDEVPEKTSGRQGFYHLLQFDGTVDHAHLQYILRDFEREGLENRKNLVKKIADDMNKELGMKRLDAEVHDEYYNMAEVLKNHMDVVDLARDAMTDLGIKVDEAPVRGGTDGSTISFMGLPTPNLFAGPENMHGRYEFVSEQTMYKAVDVILEISKLNVERHTK